MDFVKFMLVLIFKTVIDTTLILPNKVSNYRYRPTSLLKQSSTVVLGLIFI
jgi:hypothetical protein